MSGLVLVCFGFLPTEVGCNCRQVFAIHCWQSSPKYAGFCGLYLYIDWPIYYFTSTLVVVPPHNIAVVIFEYIPLQE